jgi:hypothetical protein
MLAELAFTGVLLCFLQIIHLNALITFGRLEGWAGMIYPVRAVVVSICSCIGGWVPRDPGRRSVIDCIAGSTQGYLVSGLVFS